jgi:hypothetical protein
VTRRATRSVCLVLKFFIDVFVGFRPGSPPGGLLLDGLVVAVLNKFVSTTHEHDKTLRDSTQILEEGKVEKAKKSLEKTLRKDPSIQ